LDISKADIGIAHFGCNPIEGVLLHQSSAFMMPTISPVARASPLLKASLIPLSFSLTQ
jgi:hypothetical protein